MDGRGGENIAVYRRADRFYLRLNISHNFGIQPEHLLGLMEPTRDAAMRAELGFQSFIARSCTKLAGSYMEGSPAKNVLRDLSGHGASHCMC